MQTRPSHPENSSHLVQEGRVGRVRAGCGLQEGRASGAEVTAPISDASLLCIVHCAPT